MKKKAIAILMAVLLSIALTACKEETTTTTTTNPLQWVPPVGTGTNSESPADLATIYEDPTATNLTVLPVENLPADFIYGVDISTAYEVYANGGKYYNAAGQEQDLFEILADAGVTCVRIRLWVDPYDLEGNPYGGGTNDLDTALKIGYAAKQAGLDICLDFHYSDFWADPSQQQIPKAWTGFTWEQLVTEIYDYTKTTLEAFQALGILPEMVQIGNEINNGMIWEWGRLNALPLQLTRLSTLLSEANRACKDVSQDIKTIIHLAEGGTYSRFQEFFDKMASKNVNYDIIGLSYYSYWHGTIEEVQDTMDRISARYGKPVCIMEMSYGFTTKSHIQASNIYNETMESAGGYKTSLQGQASYMRDVINAVAQVPDGKGLGIFYWEPAWLPVEGAGWANAASGRTDSDGKSSWSNQALFSYSGKALPTLYILDLIENAPANQTLTILDGSVNTDMEVTLNLSLEEQLPENTTAIDSQHRYTTTAIVWNPEEVAAMTQPGTYVVHGTLAADSSVVVTCTVTAVSNFIVDPGLETKGNTKETVVAPWYATGGTKRNETDARTGKGHVNIWASADFSYNFYQDITLAAGTYQLSFWCMGKAGEEPTIHLYAAVAGGADIMVSDHCNVSSWPNYHPYSITFTITEETIVRIGVRGEGSGGDWAHCDDFILQAVPNE